MSTKKPAKSTIEEMSSLRQAFAESASKAEKTAADLEARANKARSEANTLRAQARVMEQAIAIYIASEQEKAASAKIESLNKKATAKIGTRNFVFLIDGSGSMMGSLLDNAIDASAKTVGKLEEKAGSAPASLTVLFGDRNPAFVDMSNDDAVQKAKRGLNCGTDLAPSLEKLAASLDARKAFHLVLVSDGDMFDAEKSKEAMLALLSNNPKSTVDLVVVNPSSNYLYSRKTPMEALIETVGNDLPASRMPRVLKTLPQGAAAAAAGLVASRLKEVQPRKPKKYAPGK